MSIDRGDFDSVSEEDLQELVVAQVPEGLRVEYKLETYGNTDAGKREYLKDISAFANSQGGHLILGVEETDGVATAVVGLESTNLDAELRRLEQIARDGLEPRISGLRIKSIPLAVGRHAILLRVPRSWNPPHRVVAQGSNRFYVRNSAGVHEPNVEELRALFTESGLALDKARLFRDERIKTILLGSGERPLVNNGRLILHIVPIASFSGLAAVDIEQVHRQSAAFRPIGTVDLIPRFNYYGFINETDGSENQGYTQIFRNGILEATMADLIEERDGQRFIPALTIERYIFDVFTRYIIGLRDVGVPPPLIILLTLEGVLGVKYAVRQRYRDDRPLPEEVLKLPECILEDYGANLEHHRAVRPAFDALWNAIGFPRSKFFNNEGLWVGEGRPG